MHLFPNPAGNSPGSSSERRITGIDDGELHNLWPPQLLKEVEDPIFKRNASSGRGSFRNHSNKRFPKVIDINTGSSQKSAYEYMDEGEDDEGELNEHFEQVLKLRMRRLHDSIVSLTLSQRDDVQAIGFGGLLEMSIKDLPTDMFSWLVDGFNPVNRQFSVNGTPAFVLTGWDVAGTFKLNYSPKGMPVTVDETCEDVQTLAVRWMEKYSFGGCTRLTISELEEKMRCSKAGGPDFQRMFVLYVLHCLLTPTASPHIKLGLLKSLQNVDGIRRLNWGTFVLDHLCDSVQRYKDTGSNTGCEGCVLLIMITYFQECPWQSIPKRMEVPLISHWHGYKIGQRIKEEILGGGFGRGKYDNSWGWPVLEATTEYQMPQSPVDDIGSPLDEDFHDDLELAVLFPKEIDRSVATLIRDMNVVLFGQVERNTHLTNLVKTPGLSCGKMISATPETLGDCVKELVDNLEVIHRAIPHNGVGPNLQGLSQMDHLRDHMYAINPWLNWPSNTGRVYLSKLASRYASLAQFLPNSELEIADYCLGDVRSGNGREPLFHDGGCGWLLRRDMRTLDYGVPVTPVVITAWSRVMNYSWSKNLAPKFATPVMSINQVDDIGDIQKLKEWINLFQAQFTIAEMIFVPINFRSHYYLLVINLKANTLHCVDDVTHSDHEDWANATTAVASCVLDLMGIIGEYRVDIGDKFRFEFILAPWACRRYENECGVSTMVAIEAFKGSARDLHGIGFEWESVRAEKRISYLARIVVSQCNIYRDAVLAEVNRFIQDKLNVLSQPNVARGLQ